VWYDGWLSELTGDIIMDKNATMKISKNYYVETLHMKISICRRLFFVK